MSDWTIKRDRAEELEAMVIEFFNNNFTDLQATKIPNPTADECKLGAHPPDILIVEPQYTTTIEVKEDIYSLKSGNLCFEAEAIYKCENQGGDLIMYFSRLGNKVLCFDLHILVGELESQDQWFKNHVGNTRLKGPNPAWCIPMNECRKLKSYIPIEKVMPPLKATLLSNLYAHS